MCHLYSAFGAKTTHKIVYVFQSLAYVTPDALIGDTDEMIENTKYVLHSD